MRAATMTTLGSLRDCVYDAERKEFLVTFRDGRMYRLPRTLLPEDDGTEILGVLVEPDGSTFVVQQRSGKSFEIPWDFVLHHLEPGYAYFRGRPSQRRLEKDIASWIGRRLRELRQEKRLTADELGRRAGIHRPNVTRIESGKHVPNVDTLVRLARVLEVSPAALMSDIWSSGISLRERRPRYRTKRARRGRPAR